MDVSLCERQTSSEITTLDSSSFSLVLKTKKMISMKRHCGSARNQATQDTKFTSFRKDFSLKISSEGTVKYNWSVVKNMQCDNHKIYNIADNI